MASPENVTVRPGQAWYLLATLVVAWVLSYIDRQIIALLIPDLKRDLLLTDVDASLLQGLAFAAFFAVAGVPIGRLVDRYNRRNIIVAGIVCWCVMTMACGLATSFQGLFVARMFVGVGEACLAPAAVSMIADAFAPDKRGRAVGAMLMGGAVGTAASSFIGGAALKWFEGGIGGFAAWQLAFLAIGAAGLPVALLMLSVKEPPRSQAGEAATRPPSVVAIVRDHWRVVVPLYLAFGINMLGSFGAHGWVPTMLMREYGMTPLQAGAALGMLLLVIGLFGPVLGGWVSDLASRRSPANGRKLLVVAMFAVQLAAALTLLAFRGFEATLASFAFEALAITVTAASAMVLLQEKVPTLVRGQVIALYVVIANILGMGLGPLVVATLTDHLFANEMMVRESIGITLAVAAAIGGVTIWATMRRAH